MKKLRLEFILFDMIGTTVQDVQTGKSLILDSFQKAFSLNGYDIHYDLLNQQRGKSKIVAIEHILSIRQLDLTLKNKIYIDFMNLLNESVTDFQEIAAASNIFHLLKAQGIKIGIGSGLPHSFMLKIMHHLNWEIANFDYIGSSDTLGIGRPDPIMILDAMQQLGLTDKRAILKIGDTLVDVQEGKNAGVWTAMVLTGTQKREHLGTLKPDFVLESIKSLLNLIVT